MVNRYLNKLEPDKPQKLDGHFAQRPLWAISPLFAFQTPLDSHANFAPKYQSLIYKCCRDQDLTLQLLGTDCLTRC
jgi:hypothetical protein